MKDISLLHRVMIPMIIPACFVALVLIAVYVICGLIVAAMAVAITGRSEVADGILRRLFGMPAPLQSLGEFAEPA
jgi:hypothetical protein